LQGADVPCGHADLPGEFIDRHPFLDAFPGAWAGAIQVITRDGINHGHIPSRGVVPA
jgi:hypothetical protein